jgi:hypothetical protein
VDVIEANGEIAGELEVLTLVFAHGDVGGPARQLDEAWPREQVGLPVHEDVGGLEDRVGEEP